MRHALTAIERLAEKIGAELTELAMPLGLTGRQQLGDGNVEADRARGLRADEHAHVPGTARCHRAPAG
jgi:hypothetical protein